MMRSWRKVDLGPVKNPKMCLKIGTYGLKMKVIINFGWESLPIPSLSHFCLKVIFLWVTLFESHALFCRGKYVMNLVHYPIKNKKDEIKIQGVSIWQPSDSSP